ncbi:MAG: YbeD family protein [Pseudomonadales bacterium]
MTEQPPKIEFPSLYPIKVIMVHQTERSEAQIEEVLVVVHDHAEPVDRRKLKLNPSRQGSYVSVSLEIMATGEPQLKALHQSLLALPYVKLVL